MNTPIETSRDESSLDDIEFLARSKHRVEVLDALAERPHSRADLRVLSGASSSTIGRMLCEFEDRRWIERADHRYEATPLGAFVAEGLLALLERMETERTLRDVWQWLPVEEIGFDIESFADAVVTVPEFGSPDRTVGRLAELVEETDTVRTFAPTASESDMEVFVRNAIDGIEWECMCSPDLIEAMLIARPEQTSEAIENGNLTVLSIDDELPCACAIFDDRVALGGFDRETGIIRVMVDTDASDARRWAEDLYNSYRRDARPLKPEAIVG